MLLSGIFQKQILSQAGNGGFGQQDSLVRCSNAHAANGGQTVAAEQLRCHVNLHQITAIFLQCCGVNGRTALDQHAVQPTLSQLFQTVSQGDVSAVQFLLGEMKFDELHKQLVQFFLGQQLRLQYGNACRFQSRLFVLVRSIAKDNDRHFLGSLHQPALHGDSQAGIQYHPYRLGRILTAAGEQGVVCPHRTDADTDRSHPLSGLLNMGTGSFASHPFGSPAGTGNLAVGSHGIF